MSSFLLLFLPYIYTTIEYSDLSTPLQQDYTVSESITFKQNGRSSSSSEQGELIVSELGLSFERLGVCYGTAKGGVKIGG